MPCAVRRLAVAGLIATAGLLSFALQTVPVRAQTKRKPVVSARRSIEAKKPRVLASLSIEPGALQMTGPRSVAHFLVMAHYADGSVADVTDSAVPTLSTKSASLSGLATLRPIKDGVATLQARFGGKTAVAKVTVLDSAKPTPVSFNNDIVPILTRYGCNQGSCHGAQYGKGGYKLSLAGFDTDLDFMNTVRQAKGRRISLADPERSLLLLKPALLVPHGGGRRLEKGSPDYKVMVQWLRDGTPGPNAKEPPVAGIAVFPSERILPVAGEKQHVVVRATYTDGAVRDVTDQTRLNTLNDAIASCTPEGLVTSVGKGQTAIMVRYGGQATVATMIVPFTPVKAQTPIAVAGLTGAARIDALVTKKQRAVGLVPSPLCDDRTFIRRVSFDLTGTPPTPERVAAFLANSSSDKREKLVDELLASPEYADFWTLKWGDLLRSNRQNLGDKGMWSFTNWIHTQFVQNRPVDQFVHELILAQGSTFTTGPSNYYRVASNPQDLAETTSQLFLGVRLQCTRCHHHPFEKWSQTDYYQFAAFFARIGLKGSSDFGIFGNENVVKIQDGGEVGHPKTGARMYPTPLGVTLAKLADGKLPDPDAAGDRRRALADWLTSKDNRLFARNLVNRYWGYLFTRGLVNPIDDQRITNPPTNPELLVTLADELIRDNFDLKQLLRVLCTTQTYQRSSEGTRQNFKDDTFFTHYLPKRLGAESMLDALDFACGTQEKFNQLPLGTRAIQLPDPQVNSDFLDTFGRPQRLIACECERTAEPNLSQTLKLMNGDKLNNKVTDGNGRLAKMINAKASDDAILNTLYNAALGRPPRPEERRLVMTTLVFASPKDRKSIFEDVLVTLLNSKEFLFNH
ncbi:MAG: hypothetical protein JWL77_4508 [Chthonomonadaceae bacterium]|nr:hypothetical protein [Chthonomonadaceae bacterium]